MKLIAATLIAAACFGTATAQDWSGTVYVIGKIYPGYYVSSAGDTVNGYFMHGNQTSNQKNCWYYKNETDNKPAEKFGPDDIKSYKVADKLYRSINYSGGLLAKPLRFNLVVKDGAITEYIFYGEMGAGGGADMVYHKPHDPENDKPVPASSFALGFAKKLSKYLADNPELSEKVSNKDKGYGLLNIQAIMAEYNEWYAKKKK